MPDTERIDLKDIDDIYVEKILCMRKEDLLTSDPSKYVFAIKSTDETDQELNKIETPVDIKYKRKSVYLNDPSQNDFQLGDIISSPTINGVGTADVNFSSSNGKTYFKIIVFSSDGKTPVFYELYHYENNTFSFVKNSSGTTGSDLSTFDCTLNISVQNKKAFVSCTNQNRVVLLKLYRIN